MKAEGNPQGVLGQDPPVAQRYPGHDGQKYYARGLLQKYDNDSTWLGRKAPLLQPFYVEEAVKALKHSRSSILIFSMNNYVGVLNKPYSNVNTTS